jgi:ribosomal protein S18 acetylase RimI-like enzyme
VCKTSVIKPSALGNIVGQGSVSATLAIANEQNRPCGWDFTCDEWIRYNLRVIKIVNICEDLILGWRAACEAVAAERIYLGRVTLPPFDPDNPFPRKHIRNDWPSYVVVDQGVVVGWADITPVDIPECEHRGILGMGLLASHRGMGLGSRLLETCLAHMPRTQMSKIELTVFCTNTSAITLYRRFGFTEIGTVRDYRRLDGVTYDAMLMELTIPFGTRLDHSLSANEPG